MLEVVSEQASHSVVVRRSMVMMLSTAQTFFGFWPELSFYKVEIFTVFYCSTFAVVYCNWRPVI